MHDQKLIVFAFMDVFVTYCPLFGVLGDLHGPWHLVHVWVAWPKTRRFCILGPFWWAIAHCFGFPRWFTRPMTLMKCLRGMTKNLSFLHFWAVSWAIVHIFGFSGRFPRPMTLSTCLIGMTKNSSFLGRFVSYCPLFWGYGGIYMAHETQYMFERHDQKLVVFSFSGHFREL
jgi:hypothetical protein